MKFFKKTNKKIDEEIQCGYVGVDGKLYNSKSMRRLKDSTYIKDFSSEKLYLLLKESFTLTEQQDTELREFLNNDKAKLVFPLLSGLTVGGDWRNECVTDLHMDHNEYKAKKIALEV